MRHKERFKQMRAEVDVLTLSATPIPRTLHLSLIGVRDLSLIQTPPEERLPVRTFVTPYTESIVREVILRELDRGGQVFFVHNRVQSIPHYYKMLSDLVPGGAHRHRSRPDGGRQTRRGDAEICPARV